MARRTKSLKYEVLGNDQQGYGHRDHRSSKNRVRGYKQKRSFRQRVSESLRRSRKAFKTRRWW